MDKIAYCVIRNGGGVNGFDHTDRGGDVAFASYDKAEAESQLDGWTRLEALVINPDQVAANAKRKLDGLERLCLGHQTPRKLAKAKAYPSEASQ